MSYFSAVIARDSRGWRSRDVDVEQADDLEDLAESLRAVGGGGGPVLAILEREDQFFALVAVEADEDVRVFVSDVDAVARSQYAELLAPAADVEVEPELADEPEVAEDEEDDDAEGARAAVRVAAPPLWAGDIDLLEGLGVDGARLKEIVTDAGDDPAVALADIGEELGCAELLEALR